MNLTKELRPQEWSSVVGQEGVVESLRNQSKADTFFPVYIFHGHFGTGKTTIARILSKSANCTNKKENGDPCGVCEHCTSIVEGSTIDYFELDGASNNGVEDVKRLIDSVAYCPCQLDKKIYVIDEVHMLSKSAFNALLKTLEEPPKYAMFILCTTELNAIPMTVRSRAACYEFKAISVADIVNKLKDIVKQYNVSVTDTMDEAITLIAKNSDGALRNAEKLLEQVIASGELTEERVRELLGIANDDLVVQLIEHILRNDVAATISSARQMYDKGTNIGSLIESAVNISCDCIQFSQGFTDIVNSSGEKYKEQIKHLMSICSTTEKYLTIINSFQEVKQVLRHDYALNTLIISFLNMCSGTSLIDRVSRLEKGIVKQESTHVETATVATESVPDVPVIEPKVEETVPKKVAEEIKPEEKSSIEEKPEVKEEAPKSSKPVFSFSMMDGFIFKDAGGPEPPVTDDIQVPPVEEKVSEPVQEYVPGDADYDIPTESIHSLFNDDIVDDSIGGFEFNDGFVGTDEVPFDMPQEEKKNSLAEAMEKDAALKETIEKMAIVNSTDEGVVVSTPFGAAHALIKKCIEAYNIAAVSVYDADARI